MPDESNFQGNHAFLLAHLTEQEHTSKVLESLDIKLINYDLNMRTLTVEYMPKCMQKFFEEYVDGQGKRWNPDKPITPQVFWGKQFVAKAWAQSKDTEGELIKKSSVEALKSQPVRM